MKRIFLLSLFAISAISVSFGQDTIRAAFENSPECFGAESQFINKTYVPASLGSVNYLWKFGDGSTSTNLFGKHTYKLTDSLKTQVFNVTLIVTSKTNPPEIDSITNQTTIYGLPNVYFDWNVKNDGVNREITVDTIAIDNALYFYQWTLGGVLKSNQRKPMFSGSEVVPFTDGKNHPFSLFMRSPEGCENQLIRQFNYNPANVGDVDLSTTFFAPNPANDGFHILIPYTSLEITDLNGKRITSATSGDYISTSGLPSGLYQIRLMDNNKVYSSRILIQ